MSRKVTEENKRRLAEWEASGSVLPGAIASREVSEEEQDLKGWEVLLAFLIPLVGLILGAVYLSKPESKKKGSQLIVWSLIFWFVFWMILTNM